MRAATQAARDTFADSFLPGGANSLGPDSPELDDAERERRAQAARSVYYSKLAARRWGGRRSS